MQNTLFVVALVLVLDGLSDITPPALALREDTAPAAVALFHGTQGNTDARATVRFTPTRGGFAYRTRARGLTPGKHGSHINL